MDAVRSRLRVRPGPTNLEARHNARLGPITPAGEEDRVRADDLHQQLVVLESNDGQVTGRLQLSALPSLTFRGGWRAQIEAVRVAAERRDTGLGRMLFEWAIDEARRRDCHVVQLTANVRRRDALAFYESLGFEVTHQGLKLYLQGDATGR